MHFASVWQQFCRQPTTAGPDPGIRQQWHQGRRWYAVWVVRIVEPEVHARMASLANALGSAIRPIESSQAHITLFVSGFVSDTPHLDDDVAPSVLLRQRAALAAADLSLSLSVGPANSFSTAAFLEVHERGGLSKARAILSGQGDELRFGPYHPHVTVGVYRDTRPAAPLAAVLSAGRRLPLLTVRPAAIELVVFDAHVEGAPLLTRHRVPVRSS